MILVTGGTGLVGSHLLLRLTENGSNIRAIYRNEKKLELTKSVFLNNNPNGEALYGQIDWQKADITNVPSLQPVFIGVSHVYHCAAMISFDPNDYQKLLKNNVEGTANIVNLCVEYKIEKLCYISSIATLGEVKKGDLITEKDHYNPEADNNVYAISKYGAEMEVWRGSQEKLPVVIVNPGIILGAGFWNSGSGEFFAQVSKGFKFKVNGVCGYVDVNDVVKACILLMESKLVNERYILSSENWTFEDICTEIAYNLNTKPPSIRIKKWMLQLGWRIDWLLHAIFRKKRVLSKQSAKSALEPSYFSSEKIKRDLDFEFIPIKESLKNTSNAFIAAQALK